MPNVFSVDVEDWFHLLDSEQAPGYSAWNDLESRVRPNTERLLEELSARDIRCTFFVLGWIAKKHPALIAEIAAAGHEIASHGYQHTLIYTQTHEQFRDDLRRASDAIQAASGIVPKGFRAPGFSIIPENVWAFDVVREAGFVYDSSVFPAIRSHGGLPGNEPRPSVLPNGLIEFPVSTTKIGSFRCGYLGGGYLRLIPKYLLFRWAKQQLAAGDPLILYLHPRDIDPAQPRMKLPPHRYFRTYVGLNGCLDKVQALLDEFEWTSFEEYLRVSPPQPMAKLIAAA
jgi:polysaccharide deacetylase family protein (PEP-CTERM system associated)